MSELGDRRFEEEADELELLTRPGREDELRTFLLLLHPADVADLMHEVDERVSLAILKNVDSERAATLLSELDPDLQSRILQQIRPQELAPIVGEMETDDLTDLLQEIDEKTANEVLARLPEEERQEVTELLAYDPDSAGGIMQSELVAVSSEATIAQAMEGVRAKHRDIDILSVFVVDQDDRYVGNMALQDLVFAPPSAKVATVMTPKVTEVRTDLDQEEVARLFDRYSLVEVGVVDGDGRLKGRITADDVHEVLVEEAQEDLLLVAGASPAEPEIVYTNRVWKVAQLRLPWLISTFLAGVIATWILQRASVIFGAAVVLLTFVPVITGMSGNVGTQSAMIMIRGMAVGHIDPGAVMRNVLRDVLVGIVMATVCGTITVVLVSYWQGQTALGLCVGLALFISMVNASFLGSVEPQVLKRLGVDPAIAAGPLITSINDITGVMIYSMVAVFFLEYLR
ncbi:MAG: magnesium transporter [Deltaproteobacteria bacterium]|nr:magnesium transporter [Deltaproteobacteria bacterium]